MDGLQHGGGAADEGVAALRHVTGQIRNKSLCAQAAVLRGHHQAAAQLAEFLQVKGVSAGAESQSHCGGDARLQHPLGQAVQGRDADAAAQQDGVGPALCQIKAVAETRQHIQLCAGDAPH